MHAPLYTYQYITLPRYRQVVTLHSQAGLHRTTGAGPVASNHGQPAWRDEEIGAICKDGSLGNLDASRVLKYTAEYITEKVFEMESNKSLIIDNYVPETHHRRILLCNPPIYDTRFPWARFQQPVALLQLSTLLRQNGCDVRLLDALALDGNTLHRRRRMRVVTRESVSLNWWRFGRLPTDLRGHLIAFEREKWQPDEVYIAGFTTFWWEGVAEMVALIRQRFPSARIVLFGAYPALASEHAAVHSGADVLVLGQIEGLAGQHVDLSLYPSIPVFSYLSIGTAQRPVGDLCEEFLAKVSSVRSGSRVWQVAFADHNVVKRFPEHFRAVLQASIDHKCKVSFFALGTLHPRDLLEDPELAALLQRAGFKQLVFADDRHLPLAAETREQLLEKPFQDGGKRLVLER